MPQSKDEALQARSSPQSSPKSDAQLTETLSELLKSKTVAFIPGVSLLVNAMLGPSIPFVAALFNNAGILPPIIIFIVFGMLATMSSLFIVEAMQAIPGNKHFQGTVEFATLVNFYFGSNMHLIAQFCLYGALQSNAIQSIILSAQAFDHIVLDTVGKTCGVSLINPKFFCVEATNATLNSASPFGDVSMLFSVGMMIVILSTAPFLFFKMAENIMMQMVQWCVAAIIAVPIGHADIAINTLPAASLSGIEVLMGTIMLSIAHTFVVPSWINVKKRNVNIQTSLWTASSVAIFIYISIGLISNVFGNSIDHADVSSFLSLVVPWLVTMVIGPSIFEFQLWTSLIFVSTSNFVVPLIIYLKCNDFRKKYNKNRRVLTKKQQHLLKMIHFQSIEINKWVDNQRILNQELALKEKTQQARLGKHEKGEISINGILAKINLEGAPSKKIATSKADSASFLSVPLTRRGSTSIKDPHFVLLLGGYDPCHPIRESTHTEAIPNDDVPEALYIGDTGVNGTFIEIPVIFSPMPEPRPSVTNFDAVVGSGSVPTSQQGVFLSNMQVVGHLTSILMQHSEDNPSLVSGTSPGDSNSLKVTDIRQIESSQTQITNKDRSSNMESLQASDSRQLSSSTNLSSSSLQPGNKQILPSHSSADSDSLLPESSEGSLSLEHALSGQILPNASTTSLLSTGNTSQRSLYSQSDIYTPSIRSSRAIGGAAPSTSSRSIDLASSKNVSIVPDAKANLIQSLKNDEGARAETNTSVTTIERCKLSESKVTSSASRAQSSVQLITTRSPTTSTSTTPSSTHVSRSNQQSMNRLLGSPVQSIMHPIPLHPKSYMSQRKRSLSEQTAVGSKIESRIEPSVAIMPKLSDLESIAASGDITPTKNQHQSTYEHEVDSGLSASSQPPDEPVSRTQSSLDEKLALEKEGTLLSTAIPSPAKVDIKGISLSLPHLAFHIPATLSPSILVDGVAYQNPISTNSETVEQCSNVISTPTSTSWFRSRATSSKFIPQSKSKSNSKPPSRSSSRPSSRPSSRSSSAASSRRVSTALPNILVREYQITVPPVLLFAQPANQSVIVVIDPTGSTPALSSLWAHSAKNTSCGLEPWELTQEVDATLDDYLFEDVPDPDQEDLKGKSKRKNKLNLFFGGDADDTDSPQDPRTGATIIEHMIHNPGSLGRLDVGDEEASFQIPTIIVTPPFSTKFRRMSEGADDEEEEEEEGAVAAEL